MDDWPSQIGALMAIDASLKTFPMIGRHDDRCVSQFVSVFQARHKCAESAVGACNILVVGKTTPVYLALLVGCVVGLPAARFALKGSTFNVGDEAFLVR